MTTSQATVKFNASWKAIMECAAVEVFELMAGVRLEVNPSCTDEPRGEQTAMVGMAGALCGMTTLRCSQASAVRFASLMLGEAEAAKPATARDALGELCNMIAGNFKSKISTLADHCMLSVPTVITGENYSLETVDPSEGVTVVLTFEAQPIWVTLVTHA
jgi:chemotaxis protein CheX